jgi:hypothetical protein
MPRGRSPRRSIHQQATALALTLLLCGVVTAETGKSLLRGGGDGDGGHHDVIVVALEEKRRNLLDQSPRLLVKATMASVTTAVRDTSILARLGGLRDASSSAAAAAAAAAAAVKNTRRLQTTTNTSSTCVLPGTGFFGSISGTPWTVAFQYQAVVTTGTSITQVKGSVLPALDVGIVQGILPNFFGASCDASTPTTEIVGISTQLVDNVVDGSKCVLLSCCCCYLYAQVGVFSLSFT